MLLNEYKLKIVLPECNFSAEKVDAIITLSEDISEVLAYLHAVHKGLHYKQGSGSPIGTRRSSLTSGQTFRNSKRC